MNPTTAVTLEVRSLIEAVCDDMADDAQVRDLESLLLTDEDACKFYVYLLDLDAKLQWLVGSLQEGDAALKEFTAAEQTPSQQPAPSFLSTTLHTTFGYFSEGMPLAYLLATVICGVGLLIGSRIYVSGPEQVAQQFAPLPSPLSPLHSTVGRITGMVDCQWEKEGLGIRDLGLEKGSGVRGQGPGKTNSQSLIPNPQSLVSLGDKFALSSGLLEITYDTGAKVILQGPVNYEVESKAGGYLSVGKLTARVEKKGNDECRMMNDELRTGKNGIQHSSLSIQHLFAVRTPTATVTDLGTEFGVEVGKEGATESYVFRGLIEVRMLDGTNNGESAIQLSQGESIRVESGRNGSPVAMSTTVRADAFVRHLFAPRHGEYSGLIGQVDYSDTWKVNSSTRSGNNVPLVDANSLRVENCPGNPSRSWKFSTPTSITVQPSDGSSLLWPGHNVRGCSSGFTEAISRECYFGLEYGLRDDFIVQFDAVQTRDRINATISDTAATFECANSLSVFIRAAGTPLPEIGVLAPSKGAEVDSGLHSGIATPYQWHNYAVRFNLREKQLTVWVDRQPRGTICLATITRGMNAGSWADLPWTNQCVTVGGANGAFTGPQTTEPDCIWTDNFCIGAPAQVGMQIEQRQTPPPQEK